MSTIKRIDRDRLYTDTLYRFQYVCDFADFGAEDIAYIKGAAPLVAPLVPTIVDAVYVKLFGFDITKATFLNRNEGFKGAMETSIEDLNVNSDVIKFRKDFLSKYLVKLVTAEYDANFVKYLDWVGRIHTDTPGKKSRINVEYIHINALFAWLHGFLAQTLDSLPELQSDSKKRAGTIAAFSKLLWIQNDLFARYYVKDGVDVRDSGAVARKGVEGWCRRNSEGVAAGLAVAAIAVGVLGWKNGRFGGF
ncbi:hypothetical protein HK097_003787 [Rhizophlyctis rosea]|uniref:Globin-sensor domain-containing protein n=1 Tax=Rhizophlyctis rosea TaxID=64517 RepID=A0AAD5X0E8_9FUNG|nr:hypothetical protein HK097_003787 [Rhizophlyctis rosea]